MLWHLFPAKMSPSWLLLLLLFPCLEDGVIDIRHVLQRGEIQVLCEAWLSIHLVIWTSREANRGRRGIEKFNQRKTASCVSVSSCICVYILYVYIARERERKWESIYIYNIYIRITILLTNNDKHHRNHTLSPLFIHLELREKDLPIFEKLLSVHPHSHPFGRNPPPDIENLQIGRSNDSNVTPEHKPGMARQMAPIRAEPAKHDSLEWTGSLGQCEPTDKAISTT